MNALAGVGGCGDYQFNREGVDDIVRIVEGKLSMLLHETVARIGSINSNRATCTNETDLLSWKERIPIGR